MTKSFDVPRNAGQLWRSAVAARTFGRPVSRSLHIVCVLVALLLIAPVHAVSIAEQGIDRPDYVSSGGWWNAWQNDDDDHAAVGQIGSGSCTAVPISRRLVLTAAHCIDADGFTWAFTSGQLQAHARRERDRGRIVDSSRYGLATRHPSYSESDPHAYDIAVIVLGVALPEEHTVFPVYTGPPPYGSVVTMVGYGLFGTGTTGACDHRQSTFEDCTPTWGGGRRHIGYNLLEGPGQAAADTLRIDFDAPAGTNWQGDPYGDRRPVQRSVFQKGVTRIEYLEAMTTGGDSGGPLFYNPYVSYGLSDTARLDGVPIKALPDTNFVLGITSTWSDTSFTWGTARCEGWFGALSFGLCTTPKQYQERLAGTYGDSAGYTYVAPYLSWIRTFGNVVTTSFVKPAATVDVPIEQFVPEGDVPGPDLVPVAPRLTLPVSNAKLALANQTFSWTGYDATVTETWLHIGSAPGGSDVHDSGSRAGGLEGRFVVSGLPVDGRDLHARLWHRTDNGPWSYEDERYRTRETAFLVIPEMNHPLPGGQLPGTATRFAWNDNGYGAQAHWLEVEDTLTAETLFSSGNVLDGPGFMAVDDLPDDGRALTVRLYYGRGNGVFFGNVRSYAYTAFDANVTMPPSLDLDALDLPIAGRSTVLEWNDGGTAVDRWWVHVGSAEGERDVYDSGPLDPAARQNTLSLPEDGRRLHVRLWYRADGLSRWRHVDASFDAWNNPALPRISTPVPGVRLEGLDLELRWRTGLQGIDGWWAELGSSPGARDIGGGRLLDASARSAKFVALPDDGRALWIRLWWHTQADGWRSRDDSVLAAIGVAPALILPANQVYREGAVVATRFEWIPNATDADTWWLFLGSAAGTSDLFDSGWLDETRSIEVDLSTATSDVHARLWFRQRDTGRWRWRDTVIRAER